MLAICESNTGLSIPEKTRYLGESDETSYQPLKIGKTYRVYGILFIADRIDFLVDPEKKGPFWAPNFLFNLTENKIPPEWEICITNKNNGYENLHKLLNISCIIGYPSLTNDYQHYIGLVEGNPNEVNRFTIDNSKYQTSQSSE